MDANRKRQYRIGAGLGTTAAAMPLTAVAYGLFNDFTGIGIVAVTTVMAALFAYPALLAAVVVTDEHTLAPPKGFDTSSFDRMMHVLASMARNGLPASDRPEVQKAVQAGSDQIGYMLGKEPWVAAHGNQTGPIESHMRLRSEVLESAVTLRRYTMMRGGVHPPALRKELALILPTIVSVIRDFGLDPVGFAPVERRLPGQEIGDPSPVPMLSSHARRLADEWMGGNNASVPDLMRLEADKAATTELDELEGSWAQARSTTPSDRVDEIDASFRRGVDSISARLSETIALRARSDRDLLETNVRYLDAKHPG